MSGKFMMNGIPYLGGSGGGGGGGNVDDVKVNGTSVLDSDKIAQITSYEEVTYAEWEALPDTKYEDGIAYFIKDSAEAEGFPPLIYSTSEREIGVWKDGKPLYQKTVSFTPSGSGYYIDISDLHVSKMISCEGFVTQSNGNHVDIPYGANQSDFAIAYFISSTNRLYTSFAGSYNVSEWNITMQYTKTTDTAGQGIWAGNGALAHHYSTDEVIVGTWIDGKPIYEKTITGLSVNIPYMSWVDTGLVITNGEKCINAICRSATAIIVASVEVTSADGKVYAMGMRNTTTVLAEITLQYTKTTD